jgi:hypothetical protein
MANLIKLCTPDKKILHTWKDAIIDSVHTHTVIIPKRKPPITFMDVRTKIRSTTMHVDIYLESGYYFQIFMA